MVDFFCWQKNHPKRKDGVKNADNYSNDIYISNLTNKIKISELEEYHNLHKVPN